MRLLKRKITTKNIVKIFTFIIFIFLCNQVVYNHSKYRHLSKGNRTFKYTTLSTPNAKSDVTGSYLYQALVDCKADMLNNYITNETFRRHNGSYIAISTILDLNVTRQQWCRNYQRKNLTLAKFMDKYNMKFLLPKLAPNLKYANLYAKVHNCYEINEKLFEKLPSNYIMKATHMSGGTVRVNSEKVECIKAPFIKRKSYENKIEYMQRVCERLMGVDYWTIGGEEMYRDIPKRIIFEEDFQKFGEMQEYTFYVINGSIMFLDILSQRVRMNLRKNLLTLDWKEIIAMDAKLPIRTKCVGRQKLPKKPPHFFKDIVSHAKQIGKLFKMARIDFFVFNSTYRFSEVTACSANCNLYFLPLILEYFFGYLLMKPEVDIDAEYVMQTLANTTSPVIT